MTNTFGVNLSNRTAPASKGAVVQTGTLFVVAAAGVGPTAIPAHVQSIPDFEAAFSGRTGGATALWDYLDVFFREGGNNAYVLNYSEAGQYKPALELLDRRLGSGQVVVVGEPASANLYKALKEHAEANNRIALLDVLSTDDTKAEIETEGALAQALTAPERVGVFGSWLKVPAPAGVIGGSSRNVPATASIAGGCNKVDEAGNPNVPAGGLDFPLDYATGLVYDPNDTERAALFTSGVNMFKSLYGKIVNYGFVTPIAQTTATPFWQLNCARARMFLTAESERIGQSYYMKDIDGEGKLAGQLASDLKELCKDLWEAGGLFGKTPGEAYNVNVGVTVNTENQIASGILSAVATVRFSLYAASVNITLVSVPVAGVV